MPDPHPCALVSVHDRPATIGSVCTELRALGLPIVLADDGSGAACAAELNPLATNRVKGAAVRAGLAKTERLGYTHALQVDADGARRHLPVRVHYPRDGVGHFAPWRNNRQMSVMMRARRFFGMSLRLSRLLARRWRTATMDSNP